MGKRLKNPSPAVTLIFAVAAGAGLYWWSTSAKAETKAKKKLTGGKPPRVNHVELLTELPDKLELPKAPWLLLIYCDTDAGRAALDMFTELAKPVPDTVQLYALSASNMTAEDAAQILACTPTEAESGEVFLRIGSMFGQRVAGSWLQSVDGEDQDALGLVGNPDVDDPRMQTALAWAQGAAELPVNKSLWVGDAETIWVPWDTQPPVLHAKVGGGVYELPLPALPVDASVTVSSSDPSVDAFTNDEGFMPGEYRSVIFWANAPTTAAVISIQQGEWKRQALVRAKA